MKRFAFFASILAIAALSIPLQAEGIFCGFDPDEQLPSIPEDELLGECRVLVLATTCPEDIDSGWTTLDLPSWLTDSFIAPTVSDINTEQYKWTLSNFWAAASHEVFKVVGDVNPGNNGNFFISDSTLDNYATPYAYMQHILTEADSVIDFSDYDGDRDGYVDFVFFSGLV